MSFKKKQLMKNRSEQSGDEMDGEDAGKVRSCGFQPLSQKEKDDMIAFLVENFRESVSVVGLWKKYAEAQDTGTPIGTYRNRFYKNLAPNLHQFNCSVKTKLEIYQKYQIKVSKEYIEELKRHADVKLKEGVVAEFKMKDDNEEVEEADDDDSDDGKMAGPSSRPKRTRDRAADANSAKKARNERGFEEEDEEGLIFDHVVPGNGVRHPKISEVVPRNEQFQQPAQDDGDFYTVVAPRTEQVQQPVQDERDFYLGQYNDYQEEYIPNFGDNGMEARMMAAMREMMHGFMGTINEKFAASEEKMAGMQNATEQMINKKIAGMQSEMQKIVKKQDENMKKQITDLASASDEKLKKLETNMSTKMDSLQEAVNAIRDSSIAANSLTIGSIDHVSRESIEDNQQAENEHLSGDFGMEETTAPIVEDSSAQSDPTIRQLTPRAELVGQFPIGEFVEAVKESNKDLVEKMGEKMSEVVRSIGERSGSQGANPGPIEPNQMLKGLLGHHKKQLKTIIDECQTLDPNIKEESLRLLMEMFVTISEK